MEKILEGNVARFEVPDLLTFLNMGRRTGVLVMERRDQETKVFLRKGQPIFSTSTRDDLRLPSLLVRHGKITTSQRDRLGPRLEHAAGIDRLGELLREEGVLAEDELGPFLKLQVSEVIFDTFGWNGGVFTFFDEIPPPAAAVTLEIDLQNLIMEGVRRIDERGRLDELFPDRALIVEAVANPERVKHSVTLTGEEWRAFFLVDGRRTISEVCHLVGDPDELATLQVLHNLIVANLITLTAAPPEAAAPAGVPEPQTTVQPQPAQKPQPARKPQPKKKRPTTQNMPAVGARAEKVAVEFRTGAVARPPSEDTKQIVSPKAREYMGAAQNLAEARLVLRLQDRPEASFPMSRDTTTLGRHRNNDVVISNAKVSSFHARIDRTAEGHQLVDLGSRNGSYVNGKRRERALLENGDELRVGGARLEYLLDYSSSA